MPSSDPVPMTLPERFPRGSRVRIRMPREPEQIGTVVGYGIKSPTVRVWVDGYASTSVANFSPGFLSLQAERKVLTAHHGVSL